MPAIKYFNAKGERVPGVTTVIGQNLGWNKEALLFWANKCGMDGKHHREVSEPSADAGTLAHKLIELHIKDLPIEEYLESLDTKKWTQEITDKAEMSLLSFVQWEDMVDFEVLSTELSLVSEELQCGGTLDCVARIRKKRVLFDWKSGSGTYPDHLIQLEAYRHIYDECMTDTIEDGFAILRIDKDNVGFDWKYRFAVPEAWEAFQLLRKLHNLKNKVK